MLSLFADAMPLADTPLMPPRRFQILILLPCFISPASDDSPLTLDFRRRCRAFAAAIFAVILHFR